MRVLGDESDSNKRRKSTNCDIKVMTREVADAQVDITNLLAGLHQNAVRSYDSIGRGVDGVSVDVSRCLKEAFNC